MSNILPQVDTATRVVKVRLEAENHTFALRPGMLVNVDFALAAPAGLSVPTDAVVDSGLSQRVYVERHDGVFEPRQVQIGQRFGDRIQILAGLAEGEMVVASGTFLVDSESRLGATTESERALPGMMSSRNSNIAEDHEERLPREFTLTPLR